VTDVYERVWTVRFSDTDPHGIAHYPRIVDAVHETSDMFMEEIGWPFWRTHDEEGFGLPIVEANFEFRRPLSGGDRVTVGLTPTVGDRSVRFSYEARVADEPVFTAFEQRVCVAVGEDDAMALPDPLRAAMEPYAEDGASDDRRDTNEPSP
jgi:4-hydroxybenzoyl-CoA thioesterase